jgi:glutamate 5-kinase
VGQAALIATWAEILGRHGMTTGQVLLTRHDTAHRQQYLLACQTLERLLLMDVVPVVNENDTTAVDEIRFGDNDTLAALVGIMVRAELVVLLSDIEGVYDADPRSETGATLVEHVDRVTEDLATAAGGPGSIHGSGGMATKIDAARVLMKAGIPMVVCDGRRANVVADAAEGKPVGTYFAPRDATVGGRKLWIAYGRTAAGAITVDDGARRALTERGSSLLPAGVVGVTGSFVPGEAVDLVGPDGTVFARGLADMSAADVEAVKGTKSAAIALSNPTLAGIEVVHRDRLVIL